MTKEIEFLPQTQILIFFVKLMLQAFDIGTKSKI